MIQFGYAHIFNGAELTLLGPMGTVALPVCSGNVCRRLCNCTAVPACVVALVAGGGILGPLPACWPCIPQP